MPDFFYCQQSFTSYLCLQWLALDHLPLLTASLRYVIMKVRLFSAVTCPTMLEQLLELEFPNTSSALLTLSTLLHFNLSLWFPWEHINGTKCYLILYSRNSENHPKRINHSPRLLKHQFQTIPAWIFEEPAQGTTVCIYK